MPSALKDKAHQVACLSAFPEPTPTDEAALNERLSRPTPGALAALDAIAGDVILLGVGGKMGPTLARMARRVLDCLGKRNRVIGVSRFSRPAAQVDLEAAGVETLPCDLTDPAAVAALPDASHVIFMAGQKFGATAFPEETWAMNAYVPALVAQRYADSRIVVFSSGNVYSNVPVASGGAREGATTEPLGDYANSVLGRERIFGYFAKKNRTPIAIVRLNYAIDLRYGVLTDIAHKVRTGTPIDLTMGHVNVLWQGDANAQSLQCFAHAAVPPFIINITGPETISTRTLALRFGELLNCPPVFLGEEADTALLSNAGLSHGLFGYPAVPLEQMIIWVADWLKGNRPLLNKPTHYDARNGRF